MNRFLLLAFGLLAVACQSTPDASLDGAGWHKAGAAIITADPIAAHYLNTANLANRDVASIEASASLLPATDGGAHVAGN